MAILGIDYGAKKIGLAKSDDQHKLALPLEVLANTSSDDVLARIKTICEENEIKTIVVGVPVSLSSSGTELLRDVDLQNKQMKEVLAFIEWLKKHVSIPVEMEDERLSTRMAGMLMNGSNRNGSDDHVAAMLILQSYLDKLQ